MSKKDKFNPHSNAQFGFKDYILDQLRDVEDLVCKRMFGGFGLYSNGTFFGIIDRDKVYFKTNEKSKVHYIEQGMGPFKPTPKQTLKNYYEVPIDVIENPEDLTTWARQSGLVGSK